jgi:hypothetical protein
MKKFLILILIVGLFTVHGSRFTSVAADIRGYDGIELPAGTFIPIVNVEEISTEYCPVGYKLKFIATNDLFMYETNIVPKDTEFHGYIDKLNEPVIGTNGSMTIKITKMVLPDGFEIPIRGYIYTNNNNLIGGGISEPVKWIKMPHYQTPFKRVTLQMTPSMERKMGRHTVVKSGSEGMIILTAPAEITHSLTN